MFSKSTKKRPLALLVAIMALFTIVLTACSPPVPYRSDMIGVIVGNGKETSPITPSLVYPGEKADYNSNSEQVLFFPSNSRNYVINSLGTVANPDRKVPVNASTATGTPVLVDLDVFWTVNQDREVLLEKFWPYCAKYECASVDPSARDAEGRSATQGWVDMIDNDLSSQATKTEDRFQPTTNHFDHRQGLHS